MRGLLKPRKLSVTRDANVILFQFIFILFFMIWGAKYTGLEILAPVTR